MSHSAQEISRDPVTAVTLRLVETLITKELLLGDDLLYIFGGKTHEDTRGETKS
jgi:hypothetical protein